MIQNVEGSEYPFVDTLKTHPISSSDANDESEISCVCFGPNEAHIEMPQFGQIITVNEKKTITAVNLQINRPYFQSFFPIFKVMV